MAIAKELIKVVKEGRAQLELPKTVFYNPVQEFNRDLSVLVLRTFLKHNVWHHKNEERHVKARGGMKILDALSASGLRSVRYAKELGDCGSIVKKIVANDLSDAAVELIKRNIEINNVQDKVESSKSDAARLLHLSSASFDDRFHVIDLDPFGTAAQFFDAAVSSIGEAGLLMVTCTDLAVLCGNASESCFARYGSMSVRTDFCHENALRIILRSIESHAAVNGKYIKPLLSVSVDFYVRLFIQIFGQQAETKKSASKLSQLYLCKECKTPELNPLGKCFVKEDPKMAKSNNLAVKLDFKPAEVVVGDRCVICGGKYVLGGPIWSEPIHDQDFLTLLLKELELPQTKEDFKTFRRIEGMVNMCKEELQVPLFHSIDNISSVLKMRMPRFRDVLSALVNAGHQISYTHTNKNGFKTNAPNRVVWDIFCQSAREQKLEPKEGSLAERVLKASSDEINYDFTYNTGIEAASQKSSMLRFQVNPTANWGPKPRPLAKGNDAEQTPTTKEGAEVEEVSSKRRKTLSGPDVSNEQQS